VVNLEALVTVDADNRGRKVDSIDDVVVCIAAILENSDRIEGC